MRLVLVLAAMLVVGCQSTKKEPDYGAKPKECSQRQIEIGYCVPGEYEEGY